MEACPDRPGEVEHKIGRRARPRQTDDGERPTRLEQLTHALEPGRCAHVMERGDRHDGLEGSALERVGEEVTDQVVDVLSPVVSASTLNRRDVQVDGSDMTNLTAQLAGERPLATAHVEHVATVRRHGPKYQPVVVDVVVPAVALHLPMIASTPLGGRPGSSVEPPAEGAGGSARKSCVVTPDDLAKTYAAAWLERDDARRRQLLEQCCCDDVRFLQQGWDHEVVGIDELGAAIHEFQASWPADGEVTVELTTPAEEHHGYGRGGFVWIFPGDVRGYGTDFVERQGDKLKTIVVFDDPGPPPAASP